MRRFLTTFQAIDKTDGKIKTFISEWHLLAISWEEAEILIKTKYPYLTLRGEYICEIDEKTNKVEFSINLN